MITHLREYIDFNDVDTDETDCNPLTDKDFVMFLIDNNIYREFIYNLKQYMMKGYRRYWSNTRTFCQEISRYSYVSNAFMWDKTKEGFKFWKKVNDSWRMYLL